MLPSPGSLLGIDRFLEWYPGQEDVFRRILDWYQRSDKRFLGLSVAAGSGKSVNAFLAAKLLGVRTCILTATKGLQDQYMRDVSLLGGVQVKGRNNFPCTLAPTLTCDDGPCHDGMSCGFRQSGCPYYDQLNRAVNANIVVTNYAYYLAQSHFSTGLGDFGLLVLDEAHLAFGALENHLSVYLHRDEVEHMGIAMPRQSQEWILWQQWAKDAKPRAQEIAGKLEKDVRDLRSTGSPIPGSLSRSFRSARSTVLKLSSMESATGRWVADHRPHGWMFIPVWVASNGGLIYQSTPKIMLMSALLSRKTMEVLGIPDYDWYAVGSKFPIANTPMWHVATSQIKHTTDDYGLVIWLSRIDQIIQRRLDRKGIIFTVSYSRRDLILQNSRFADIMITHSTNSVGDAVRRFKESEPPAVLVSPSVTSGWDFPQGDGKPQYVIVSKIPYPDTTDVVMKARREDDKDWPAYLAMETLVNECFRCTRSITDKAEVIITDDCAVWFIPKYKDFAPPWFMERYRGTLAVVPEPLV